MFEIEKNVELKPSTRNRKYPFNTMDVGDSFYVQPGLDFTKIRQAAFAWGKINKRKFSTRKDGDGYRVWRTA